MNHKEFTRAVSRFILAVALVFVALCIIMATTARAYEGARIRTKRQEALHQAADLLRAAGLPDDDPAIRALSAEWWKEQEDLDIIAKVIQNEADPEWCEREHSVAVGAVVCNRVKSPHFPNTVREVVEQPGQYLKAYTSDFSGTTRLAYEAAKAALDGDHDVPSDCYWQDTTIQGTAIWKAFTVDTGYFRSTTYICRGISGVA